ncbi:RrF2 family transcriptional regulator [Pigmentibacter ruber]|nr:nitric oxide-sensing transcriptional repressor NsrR [Pigmentibacter ruber]
MQLTLQSDYTLRVLIYISYHQDKIVTIEEIANFYEISAHHLTRIIHKLGELGYIYTIRGKGGGFRLAKTPSEINIGELIEKIESHFNIVECFDPTKKRCKILGACLLKPLLADAMQKFIDTLKQKTLADLVINNNRLKNLITKS